MRLVLVLEPLHFVVGDELEAIEVFRPPAPPRSTQLMSQVKTPEEAKFEYVILTQDALLAAGAR